MNLQNLAGLRAIARSEPRAAELNRSPPFVASRVETLEQLEAEWEQLDCATQPRLPFTRPAWTSAWLRHFAEHRALVRDELWLLAIRDETMRLRGIAPMVLTESPGVGLLRTRRLRLVGSDPNITEIRPLLCAPADAQAVVAALLQYWEARSHLWHVMQLTVPEECVPVVAAWPGVELGYHFQDFVLLLPESWDEFRAGLARNIKESLRKGYNSLKRDGHSFEFRALQSPSDVMRGLETFLELHAARAGLKGTIDHANFFESECARAFLTTYMREAAARDEARVFELVIGGKVVASRLGFVHGEDLYLYFSGFDPSWAQYGVMTTTVAEIIRWAIGDGLASVNLSPGRDVSKTRWRPIEVGHQQVTLPSPTLQGRAVHRVFAELTKNETRWANLLNLTKRHR